MIRSILNRSASSIIFRRRSLISGLLHNLVCVSGLVFMAVCTSSVFADEPKTAIKVDSASVSSTSTKAEKLIEILGLKEQTDLGFIQIEAAIKMSAKNIAQSLASSKELDSIIESYQNNVIEEYRNMFSWEAQSVIYQSTYASKMSESELDAAIQFLSSKAGMTLLSTQAETAELSSLRAEQQKQITAPKLQALKKDFIAELTSYAEKTRKGAK